MAVFAWPLVHDVIWSMLRGVRWTGAGVAVEAECGVGIVRLDHVQMGMPAGREVEAVAFYAGVLGIPHVPKPDRLAVRGGCWFEDGDLKVHLGVEASFRPATKAHPAFIVDDVRAMAAAVAAAGFAVKDDEPLDGFDRVYVSDPFGNRIELMQPNA